MLSGAWSRVVRPTKALRRVASESDGLLPHLAEGTELPEWRKRLTVALCGSAIYGCGAFVWQMPVLVDHDIHTSLGLTEAEMTESDSLIFFAWAFGAALLGKLADSVGRRPVSLASGVMVVLHLLGIACSTGLAGLCFFRMLGGFALGGCVPGFMLGIEHTGESRKASTATALNIFNHAGAYAVLGVVHVGCDVIDVSWRVEMATLAVCHGVLVALTALLVPESPVFLLAQAKARQAAAAAHREAKGDAKPSTPKAEADDASGAGLGSLFRPPYRQLVLALTCSMVAGALVYYHLSFEAGAISDHVVLNVVLLSLSDIPGLFLSSWLCGREGADTKSSATLLFGLTALLLAGVAAASSLGASIMALCFAGKMASAGAIQLVYLLPSEFFPPKLRTTGFGFASASARIACAAIPAVAQYMSLSVASLLFGVLASGAALTIRSLSPRRLASEHTV